MLMSLMRLTIFFNIILNIDYSIESAIVILIFFLISPSQKKKWKATQLDLFRTKAQVVLFYA